MTCQYPEGFRWLISHPNPRVGKLWQGTFCSPRSSEVANRLKIDTDFVQSDWSAWKEIIDKDFTQSYWLALQFWVQQNRIFTMTVPQASHGKSAWFTGLTWVLSLLIPGLDHLKLEPYKYGRSMLWRILVFDWANNLWLPVLRGHEADVFPVHSSMRLSRPPAKCRVTQKPGNPSVLYRKTKNPFKPKICIITALFTNMRILKFKNQLMAFHFRQNSMFRFTLYFAQSIVHFVFVIWV